MTISVNTKYIIYESSSLEHQGLEALTGVPVQKSYRVFKKGKTIHEHQKQ